jgi:carboxypeptidase T
MLKIYAFLYLIAFQTIQLSAQNKDIYHRATVLLEGKNIATLAEIGIEVEHGDYQKGRSFTTDFSEYELELIRQTGFEVKIDIENISNWYANQSRRQVTLPRNDACEGASQLYDYPTPINYTYGTMGGYYKYQEMLDILEDMHNKYPNLISLKAPTSDSILTHEGRPQYWVKISDNASTNNEGEPQILYTALHHAREPNSLSQMIFFMWHLLENYNTDPEIQYIVNNLELCFVPCVNPDGYIYNEINNPEGGGLWRKNRRDNGDGSFGVDLNRNYGYEWGYNDQGSSPDGNTLIYRGPAAFSEPETRMLRDFCLKNSFKIALNYHTYSNLLIYPWGYSDSLADSTFYNLSQILTEENSYKAGTSSQTVGYAVNGTSDDWMFGGDAHIYSMTPEVGPAIWGFWPAQDAIDFLNKSALEQNLVAAKCVLRFGEAKDKSPKITSTLTNSMPVSVTRYGFESGVFQVNLIPLSANISSVSGAQTFDLQQFEAKIAQFQYTLHSSISFGEEFKFLLEINNGEYTKVDTLIKIYGNSAQSIFSEAGNSLNNWTSPFWNVTTTHFISPPTSLTDSPFGDYAENQFNFLISSAPILIPVSASEAYLSFQGRWLIEDNWDYTQILVSTDQTNWQPLCGTYTNLGIGTNNQPDNQPLFDGTQTNWVSEKMDMTNYIGQAIWIRFDMVSDGFEQMDGFYFDDLNVEYVTSVGTQTIVLENFELSQNIPNPSKNSTVIEWTATKNLIDADAKLLVYNALGQIVLVKNIKNTTSPKMVIDTKTWESGTYFYQIRSGKGMSEVKKMLIEK